MEYMDQRQVRHNLAVCRTKKFANIVNRTKEKEDNGMRPLKGKVSITLDSDIIQTIRDYAEKDDRSFSQYINMVLKEYISRQGRTDET